MAFSFVQMSDPQFGMFASVSEYSEEEIRQRRLRGILMSKAPRRISGFADETRLYTRAIEKANSLKPDFVVVCGDMIHNMGDDAEMAELFRITEKLDERIPIHWVSGNHDVGESPTSESIAAYRENFGADNYSFDHSDCHFTVINSSVASDPSNVPREWDRIVQFLGDDLSAARRAGAQRLVLLVHHPLFLRRADEGEDYFTIPPERRDVIMRVLRDNDASAVFAGHMHRNNYARDGGIEMITTGAVGYPLGDDPSGIRLVTMDDSAITHRYFPLDEPSE